MELATANYTNKYSKGSSLDDIEKVAVCSSLRLLKTKNALLKHPSDTKVLTMKMEILLEPTSNKLLVVGFNPLVHSFRALSTLRRSGLRTASAAAKPCQGDSSEVYLITGRIPMVAAAGQKRKSVSMPVRRGKLIQKLLLNQKCMGYLVRAYYSISPTSFQDTQLIQKLRDDKKCMKKVEPSSKSKTIEDIISIGSFVEAIVLNHYVLVRKILRKCDAAERAYEAQREKDLAIKKCEEMKFLMIDTLNLPPHKRAFIKRQQSEIIRKYQDAGADDAGTNSAFITLIPKVSNPLHIKDYRPISLIGVQYKIIANRMAKVIDKVVSNEQSAFILGRQILDGPLMLSEVIEWYKKKHKKLVVFKVDFEKAFDSGDPLSPFLFILVMEGLHLALKDAVHANLFHGAKVGDSGFRVSHFFYADDVVIISDWSSIDMDNIIRILHVFYLASGLKINIYKSNVFGIGVSSEEVADLARGTGCTTVQETILNLLERTRARFFWGETEGIKKLALLKWNNVLASLDKGGLGIGSLKVFNLALIQKWRCRLMQNPDAIWVRLIKAIHGPDAGFDLHGCNTQGLWAKIVGSINHLHSSGIIPLQSLRFKVGCGSKIHFWKDLWIGDGPL
ncbi:putative RNA-directed DNA polymerase, eukaryota, reverse transcriptase zinc-binding domain protein [Tanacetum coccineum]